MAAGESRIHAGFHIKSGNEDALAAGSEIGEKVWLVCTSLWDPPASSSQGTQKLTNATTLFADGRVCHCVVSVVTTTMTQCRRVQEQR